MEKKFKSHKFSKRNLHNTNDLFPFIPKPHDDELLSSWVYRLAQANFFPYTTFLKHLYSKEYHLHSDEFPKAPHDFQDIDQNCPDVVFAVLEKKTGIPKSTLINMTIHKWKYKYKIPHSLFVNLRSSKFGGIKFCPLCLKEKNAGLKKHWKLNFITCCEIHQIFLLNKCTNPNCNQSIHLPSFNETTEIYCCNRCGWKLDFFLDELKKVSNSTLERTKLFLSILENEKWISANGEIFSISQFFTALSTLLRFFSKFENSNYLQKLGYSKKLQEISFKYNYLKYDDLFKDAEYMDILLDLAVPYLIGYPYKILELLHHEPRELTLNIQNSRSDILEPFAIGPDYIFSEIDIFNGIIQEIKEIIQEHEINNSYSLYNPDNVKTEIVDISYSRILSHIVKFYPLNLDFLSHSEIKPIINPILEKRREIFFKVYNFTLNHIKFRNEIYILIKIKEGQSFQDIESIKQNILSKIPNHYSKKEENIRNSYSFKQSLETLYEEINIKNITHICEIGLENYNLNYQLFHPKRIRYFYSLFDQKTNNLAEKIISKPEIKLFFD